MRSSTEDASTSFLRIVGVAALVALAAEIALMPWLVELDAALWRAVLFARACGTDHAVDRLLVAATRMATLFLAAVAVLGVRQHGVRATWPPLAVCAIGLLTGRVMKNVFMRARPSSLLDAALGHSFPSAHVMNTTLAALAVLVLAAGFRHRIRWWAMATALLAIVAAGRLLLGRHWLLDVVGGGLAALALMGLCLPLFRRRPLFAPAALALALAAVLVTDLYWHPLHIRLPTPLDRATGSAVEVVAGTDLGASTRGGDWEATSERASGRAATWLRGAGTVVIELPATGAALGSSLDAGAELMLAGRPDIDGRRCAVVQVAVNGRALRPFVPFEGWREYRLPLPPGVLRSGVNEMRIEVVDERNSAWRFALVYLRVAADAIARL